MTRRIGLLLAACLWTMPATAAAQAPAAQTPPVQTPPATDPPPAVSAAGADRPDPRAQYPALLRDSFISIGVGAIDYPFSGRQLEPGFQATTVVTPRVGVRVALFGHEFTPHLSAQLAYMRPGGFVSYRDVNGDQSGHHVRVDFGALTVRWRQPVGGRVALDGEVGVSLTSREGFSVNGQTVVRDASYGSAVYGAGLDLRLNARWELTAGATLVPANARSRQPRTLFTAGGFRYTVRPLSDAQVRRTIERGAIFPVQLVTIEYTTGTGYGINSFFARKVPIFWGGDVDVDRGVAVHYDRNVFHSRSLFSFDVGTSAGVWRSRDARETFATVSCYPLVRLTFLRTKAADVYFQYSLAGPTFITRRIIDGRDTGRHFTFQDFMGIGVFLGAARRTSLAVKIDHYSNGNLFPHNAAVTVPLTISLGITF